MGYRKSTRFRKIVVIIVAIIFITSFIFGVASPLFSGRNNPEIYEGKPDANVSLKSDSQAPIVQPDAASDSAKYMTNSSADNIDILVNYLNPVTGDKDFLKFDVIMGTHSVDLSKYEDLSKYVELRTESGVAVSSGFEWLDCGVDPRYLKSFHHISGKLKIENQAAGKSIIGADTKSFRLVFKNIGSTAEREHLYELDKLK